ncbi:hypothetical protein B9Z19DRAFT_775447 [Tuber borchii]|uniref:Uncharacterized protein n=1 Tax=Tuber borchii TaxID=42251 RepID=A0A2T6ZWW8_TUBBO|nr:hypothetical protein B9Z19DRAFT_775447 [Tuber borchii]
MSGGNKTGREKGGKYTVSTALAACQVRTFLSITLTLPTIPSTPLNTIMGLGDAHDLITNKQPEKIAIVSVGAQEQFSVWVARDVPRISQMAARKHRKLLYSTSAPFFHSCPGLLTCYVRYLHDFRVQTLFFPGIGEREERTRVHSKFLNSHHRRGGAWHSLPLSFWRGWNTRAVPYLTSHS